MSKDINRLKVVLAERNEPTNGSLNNWVKILQPYLSGVIRSIRSHT